MIILEKAVLGPTFLKAHLKSQNLKLYSNSAEQEKEEHHKLFKRTDKKKFICLPSGSTKEFVM